MTIILKAISNCLIIKYLQKPQGAEESFATTTDEGDLTANTTQSTEANETTKSLQKPQGAEESFATTTDAKKDDDIDEMIQKILDLVENTYFLDDVVSDNNFKSNFQLLNYKIFTETSRS